MTQKRGLIGSVSAQAMSKGRLRASQHRTCSRELRHSRRVNLADHVSTVCPQTPMCEATEFESALAGGTAAAQLQTDGVWAWV